MQENMKWKYRPVNTVHEVNGIEENLKKRAKKGIYGHHSLWQLAISLSPLKQVRSVTTGPNGKPNLIYMTNSKDQCFQTTLPRYNLTSSFLLTLLTSFRK